MAGRQKHTKKIELKTNQDAIVFTDGVNGGQLASINKDGSFKIGSAVSSLGTLKVSGSSLYYHNGNSFTPILYNVGSGGDLASTQVTPVGATSAAPLSVWLGGLLVEQNKSSSFTLVSTDNGKRFVMTASANIIMPSIGTLGNGFEIEVINQTSAAPVLVRGASSATYTIAAGEIGNIIEANGKQWVLSGPGVRL